MLFQNDFNKPAPEGDSEPAEKTGPGRFLEILTQECGTLLELNVLFWVSCIPIVTIPPAVLALNRVVRRIVRDKPVKCFRDFWAFFRKDWGRAYAAFLTAALPLVCAGYGMRFYLSYAGFNPLFYVPALFCTTIFFIALLASGYFYGLMDGGRPWREALRLSLILGIGRPLRAVLAAIFVYVPLLAAVLLLPLSLLYLILIGFSLPCMVGHFFLRTVLKQYAGE